MPKGSGLIRSARQLTISGLPTLSLLSEPGYQHVYSRADGEVRLWLANGLYYVAAGVSEGAGVKLRRLRSFNILHEANAEFRRLRYALQVGSFTMEIKK